MDNDQSKGPAWSRIHFTDKPEERHGLGRRKDTCFIANDRRSGIAYRRKERIRYIERKIAFSKIKFYPDYYRVT